MALGKILLLPILFVAASCGERGRHRSEVILPGQSIVGMPAEYKDKNGLISSLDRQGLFLDTDKDKIRDRDDFDIDNDGVPNDCDLAPFSKTAGKEDTDADGIPDFCDKNDPTQEEVFKKYGLLLNINESGELKFDPKELSDVLAYVSRKATLPSTELLTLTLTEALPVGEFGVYDPKWKNVRYRTDDSRHEEFPDILQSSWVLVHELFHFVGAANKVDYQKMSREFYPTQYSRLSKEEYFAELETYRYFTYSETEQSLLP